MLHEVYRDVPIYRSCGGFVAGHNRTVFATIEAARAAIDAERSRP